MIAFAPCEHTTRVKAGKTNCGTQRFKCKDCGTRFIEEKPLGSMKIERVTSVGSDAGFGIQAQVFLDLGYPTVDLGVLLAGTSGAFDQIS